MKINIQVLVSLQSYSLTNKEQLNAIIIVIPIFFKNIILNQRFILPLKKDFILTTLLALNGKIEGVFFFIFSIFFSSYIQCFVSLCVGRLKVEIEFIKITNSIVF